MSCKECDTYRVILRIIDVVCTIIIGIPFKIRSQIFKYFVSGIRMDDTIGWWYRWFFYPNGASIICERF